MANHGGVRGRGAIAAVAALLLAVAGCGGGHSRSHAAAKTLTWYRASQPELDPGVTYNVEDFAVVDAMQRRLFTAVPGRRGLEPDLATGPAIIRKGGREVVVHLRSGVHYSAPVNREVTAGDIRYAIERGFTARVACPYARAYFGDLHGVAAFAAGRARHIAGIQVPDPHTVRFELDRPSAALLVPALSLPLGAPVPEEWGRRWDTGNRSTYVNHLVATGPYMLAPGAKPAGDATLVRNPAWNRSSDPLRPATLDRIVMRQQGDSQVAALQALKGKATVADELVPPPAAHHPAPGHLVRSPQGSTVWLSLPVRRAPFDRLAVRQAIAAALDRAALIKVLGYVGIGRPATHLLPPATDAFTAAGGDAGPAVGYTRWAAGDLALAHRLLKAAGYPTGKVTGAPTVTVAIVAGATPASELIASALEKLGFHTRIRAEDFGVLPTRCPNPADTLVCLWGVNQDFADPATVLAAEFSSTGGYNLSGWKVPSTDAQIAGASAALGDARTRAWAAIDDGLVRQVAAVPLIWNSALLLASRDVDGAFDPQSLDVAFAWTRVGG